MGYGRRRSWDGLLDTGCWIGCGADRCREGGVDNVVSPAPLQCHCNTQQSRSEVRQAGLSCEAGEWNSGIRTTAQHSTKQANGTMSVFRSARGPKTPQARAVSAARAIASAVRPSGAGSISRPWAVRPSESACERVGARQQARRTNLLDGLGQQGVHRILAERELPPDQRHTVAALVAPQHLGGWTVGLLAVRPGGALLTPAADGEGVSGAGSARDGGVRGGVWVRCGPGGHTGPSAGAKTWAAAAAWGSGTGVVVGADV